MKKIFLVLAILTLIVGLSLLLRNYNSFASDPPGCCMERKSTGSEWKENGLNLKQCRKLNSIKDGDDIFQKDGLVWWNIDC